MRCNQAPRCDTAFNILAPRALVEAVQQAAARNWQPASAYARAALLRQLEHDGIRLKENKAAA
jgi:hypothetical protein